MVNKFPIGFNRKRLRCANCGELIERDKYAEHLKTCIGRSEVEGN